jgi:uncharacterized protein (TIGR03083 family)
MTSTLSPLPPDADLSTLIDAWESAHDDLLELLDSLTDEQWSAPTDLPGWSVADVVAHITWLELWLMGEAEPAHEPDWAVLPHATSDKAKFMETPVDRRRSWSREEVMAETRETLQRRLASLRSDFTDRSDAYEGPFGPGNIGGLVQQRTFDTWVHEQDIRRAVGMPGGLDTSGARASATQIAPGLGKIVGKGAGAGVGESVRFVVIEPGVVFDMIIRVDDDGRAKVVDLVDAPTATVTMPFESFMLATCGRAADWRSTVTVTGDADLVGRVLANMTLTP